MRSAGAFVHALGIAASFGIALGAMTAASESPVIRPESTDATVLATRFRARTCFGRKVTLHERGPVILGTNHRDVIHAGRGNDTIFGFDGSDFICGGRGDDSIIGGNQYDRADGGIGDDTCETEMRRRC